MIRLIKSIWLLSRHSIEKRINQRYSINARWVPSLRTGSLWFWLHSIYFITQPGRAIDKDAPYSCSVTISSNLPYVFDRLMIDEILDCEAWACRHEMMLDRGLDSLELKMKSELSKSGHLCDGDGHRVLLFWLAIIWLEILSNHELNFNGSSHSNPDISQSGLISNKFI